jgi:hypothetical protein
MAKPKGWKQTRRRGDAAIKTDAGTGLGKTD